MDEATPFAELQGLIADVHLLLRDVRLERQMLFSIALQSGDVATMERVAAYLETRVAARDALLH
jgi:hypothetical protein